MVIDSDPDRIHLRESILKPIILSEHTQTQMLLRGAEKDEVIKSIQEGQWQPAKRGRIQAKTRFAFDKLSPINGLFYRYKDVEAIFQEEKDKIIVITVKVYYSND